MAAYKGLINNGYHNGVRHQERREFRNVAEIGDTSLRRQEQKKLVARSLRAPVCQTKQKRT